MPTGSRPLGPARAWALCCLAAAALIGCTSGDNTRPDASTGGTPACAYGASDPADALRGFLAGAQTDSQDAARRFLQPGGDIPTEAWTELGQRLDGVDLDELKLTSETMATATSLRVLLADGSVLGTFEAHVQEEAPGCSAVVWGTYSDEPGSDASEPASA